MRKLKLLLAGLAMLVGGVSANAQASYNHEYKDGVTVAAGGNYFLYNLGSKMFLTDGMNWGTHATTDHAGRLITFTSAADGKYNISTASASVNNGAEAKAGYLWPDDKGDCWVDSGTQVDWSFNSVSVDGYTNVYTINCGDSKYLYSFTDGDGSKVNVGDNTNNNYSYWIIVPKTTRETAKDYTFYLQNTDFNRPWQRKIWTGFTNDNQIGGNKDNLCAERWHAVSDVSQTIAASVPNGKYILYAQGFWGQDGSDAGPVLYANSDSQTLLTKGSENSMSDASTSFSAGNYVNNVSTVVTNGSLKVGVNITSGSQWVIFDNFYLKYLGTCLVNDAVALPDGGAMTAGTWYYFDIAVAGDDYLATATTLGDIICISDGNTLTEEATSGTVTLTAKDNDFAVGRYYVKSSSANNLVVAAPSYSYIVGSATADISYIQAGNTVTISYEDLATNNPSPTLVKNFSGVTFGGNSIEVTPIANGFTFEVPSVTAATDYTLAIPAAAIGYSDDGGAYNAAQNITLKTPAIFDGVYYLKNSTTNTYISRAGKYNTQAVLDEWGLAFNISTDAENKTKLQYFDSYLWVGFDGDCYGDSNGDDVRSFNVTKDGDNYKFKNTNNSKYLAADETKTVANAEDATGNVWVLESTEAHKANYTANANTQAADAADNVTLLHDLGTITTKAALETELASNYTATPIDITGAKAEKFNSYPGNVSNTPVTYYSETVDLEPGLYKLSVDAFQRAAGNNRVAAADGARGIIYLYAGDAKTQLKSVMEYGADDAYTLGDNPNFEYGGKNYPNSLASGYAALETGNYTNDVYFYVASAGDVEIGIKNPSRMGGNFSTWCVYDNWTLTRYEKKPFTASFVNGKKWEHVYAYVWDGTGELAGAWPGTELDTPSGSITYNGEDLDIFTYSVVRNDLPEKIIFNDGTLSDPVVGTNKTANLTFVDGMRDESLVTFVPVYAVVGSNWAETDKAIFSAKWDQETTTDILTESAGVWSKTYSGQTLDRDSIAFKVIKKNYLEAPTAAGWYPDPGSNQKIVLPVKGIYDITITFNGNEGSPVVTGEATKVSEAVTISDKRWATTVTNSPLNFSGVTEFDAYTATVADSKVVLTKVDNVQAETGLVLRLKDAEAPDTYYVPVAESSSTDKGSLKFSSTLTYNTWHDNGGENNKFYGLYVNGEGKAQFTLINCSAGSEVTIPAQKAFLLLRDGLSLARMEIVYDNETTGISNLNAETGAEGIYNLNGQRVTAPAKGRLYIVNGKKVVKK